MVATVRSDGALTGHACSKPTHGKADREWLSRTAAAAGHRSFENVTYQACRAARHHLLRWSAQRSAVVSADIIDTVEFAGHMEQHHDPLIDFHGQSARIRDARGRRDFDEITHGFQF